ncbi:MAG: hypothetical protein WBE58_16310 [Verrucomicrobiales bacterium]|nr:hypothetical protein [Verrucomicrobiales bacterium]
MKHHPTPILALATFLSCGLTSCSLSQNSSFFGLRGKKEPAYAMEAPAPPPGPAAETSKPSFLTKLNPLAKREKPPAPVEEVSKPSMLSKLNPLAKREKPVQPAEPVESVDNASKPSLLARLAPPPKRDIPPSPPPSVAETAPPAKPVAKPAPKAPSKTNKSDLMSLAERELARRKSQLKGGDEAAMKAAELLRSGDYEGAKKAFLDAYSKSNP